MGFGDELRDQLGDIDRYTQNGIVYMQEVRDYVKERVALEKDYATKLDALSKTYSKKIRRSGYSYYGAGATFREDNEKKGDTTIDLSNTTSSRGLLALFGQAEVAAKARVTFADKLSTHVSDVLKIEYKRKEDARLKHMAFSEQLAQGLAASKSESDKYKQAYRQACNQLEAAFLRYDKAPTPEQSEKLKKEWNDAMSFKNDRQNEYLLSLQMFNAHKKNYYFLDMPALMDNLQDQNEHTISRAREIMTEFINLEKQCLNDIILSDDTTLNTVAQMSGPVDSQTFVAGVKKEWTEPADEQFSPFTDKDTNQLEKETGQVLLLNTLLNLRTKIEKQEAEIVSKVKEIEGLKNLKDSYQSGLNKGDPFEVQQKIIEAERARTVLNVGKVKMVAQVELIESVLGYVSTKQHTFKPVSSGTCVVCRTGLSLFSRGLNCQECKTTAHAKCSTRIPPCGMQYQPPVASAQPSAGGNLVRSKTTKSMSGARSSVRNSTAAKGIYATVLYDFAKANEGELDAKVGEKIKVIEADDGNGWMTGELNGIVGVIPANYVDIPKEAFSSASQPAQPATNAPELVRALYDYEAQVDLELSIREGDTIEVTNKNVGEGWWEGKLNGKVGQFPQNYVEPI